MVSIPLSHARSQRSLKLLELPPDLLEQLLHAPETPPTGGRSSSTLYLKAPPAPSATDPPSARTPVSDNFVNLCTHDRTWHLQQVNSSNSLLILQAGSECTGHHNGHRSSGGLSSIAQCSATLEAVPPPLAKRSAEPFLHRRVHVYDGKNKNNDPAHPTVTGSEVQRTIEALFSDIPLSQADCERQWVESCCFVDHDPSSAAGELVCWRPSVSVKLDAWRKLLEVSILRDIDVKKQFLVSDLWNAVVDEEDGTPFPKAVFDAIVRRVMPSWQQSSSFTSTLEWANVDKGTAVTFTGQLYLEVVAPNAAHTMSKTVFQKGWRDLLPESWREDATFDKLTNVSHCPDRFSIYYTPSASKILANPKGRK